MKKLILAAAVAALALLLPRQIFIIIGNWKAAGIVHEATGDDRTILTAAKWVARHYTGHGTTPAYYHLIPFATTRLLPRPVRLPLGTIEFLTLDGECDSAVRSLHFLLARLGFRSEQINIITPVSQHSALAVRTHDGRKVFVDPFFGIAAHSAHGLESIDYLISAIRKGDTVANVTLALRKNPDVAYSYYQSWRSDDVMSAPQGEDPHITATLPALTAGRVIQLGAIDGRSYDVYIALAEIGLTTAFTYVGSRYDRAWTRTLVAAKDVRVEFVLTDKPDLDLIHSVPKPHIDGRTLSWTLAAGEKLVLHDNRAPNRVLSSRFENVDVIRIVPLGDDRQHVPAPSRLGSLR